MRDWKPGDVAIVDGPGKRLPITFFESRDTGELMFNNGAGHQHPVRILASTARQLVVLDLDEAYGCWAEKRDPAVIVERLRETNSVAAQAIADQIEQQTKPPKPAEPTGLGAVVEDSRGERYVRLRGTDFVWPWATSSQHEARWSDIDVVRVLSEGVTA